MPDSKPHLPILVKGHVAAINGRTWLECAMPPPLSDRIRYARKRADLSQRAVGEALGITPQAVNQWERGRTEPTDQMRLYELAKLTGVSPLWLLLGVGLPEPAAAATVDVQFGVAGGRQVPVIDPADAAKDLTEAIAVATTFAAAEFPCGNKAFRFVVWNRANAPEYRIGDAVIIDPDVPPEPTDMVLAALGAEARPVFGELRFERPAAGDAVRVIQPLNGAWPGEQMSPSDRVIGVMTEHVRPRRAGP